MCLRRINRWSIGSGYPIRDQAEINRGKFETLKNEPIKRFNIFLQRVLRFAIEMLRSDIGREMHADSDPIRV